MKVKKRLSSWLTPVTIVTEPLIEEKYNAITPWMNSCHKEINSEKKPPDDPGKPPPPFRTGIFGEELVDGLDELVGLEGFCMDGVGKLVDGIEGVDVTLMIT